jgi:prephenate dehydrogenase
MAVVLGLSHFIAIVSADTLLSFSRLKQMGETSGITFKLLSTLAESVISEDPALYASLQMNLPKLADIERSFQNKAKEWVDLVERKDRQGFTEKMTTLKDKFNQVNPDFSKAYEDMYKIVDGL